MELERAKEERRRELEMMRRQQQMAKEEEMRRGKLAQAQQRRARYSPGRIVLGPDGNLYRIISPTADDEQLRRGEERFPAGEQRFSAKKRFSSSDESKENSDEQMIAAEERDSINEESESSSEWEKSSIDDDVCASHTHEDHFYDALDTQTHPASHTEVEVEDVPDEEDEELRDLHSIWRNRSPSPGQWMEPIE